MNCMKKSWPEIFSKRNIVLAPEWANRSGILDFCRNIEAHSNSPAARVMKDDAAARVVTASFDHDLVVIKQYHFKSWRKALSRSIRPTRAKRSWDNSIYLKQQGVTTVAPVALIEDRFGFLRLRSFFVGGHIAGEEARGFFNDPNKTLSELSAGAQKVLESILEFHSKGLFIGDTKDSNVLINHDRAFWVDLDDLTGPRLKWLSHRKWAKDWNIFFNNWNRKEVVHQLFMQAVYSRLNRNEWQKFAAKLAFYAKKHFSSRRPFLSPYLRSENFRGILAEAEKIAKGDPAPGWENVQSAKTAIVARKELAWGGVYCKVFLERNKLEKIKRLFKSGRGARAVRNEHMMRAAGFLVPQTLCRGRHGEKEFIVSREIKGVKMNSWLALENQPHRYRRSVLKSLGETVGALHSAGFVHGDLRLNNILLQEDKGRHRFYFLDNERTKLYRQIPHRQIVKNLRQVNTDASLRLTRSDRLRIFKAYQKVRGVFKRSREKRLLAKIEKKTAKRLSRSGRLVNRGLNDSL